VVIPIFIFYTLALAVWPHTVSAMNWEGHDEWFHDNSLFLEFMEGIPPPLLKPKPVCSAIRQRHIENVYEQTALPSLNCVEDEALG
jgi:hypothetical protein